MHNASNGVTRSTKVSPWTDAVPAFLLQGSDQSSTCLICHGDNATGASGAGIATAANKPYVITNTSSAVANMNFTPGGDFGWLTMDAGNGQAPLERRGHNVVASDFGMVADAGMRTAPGGTFSVDTTGVRAFACSNCHDPHGRFRLQNDGTALYKWAGPNPTTGLIAISQPIFASSSYGVAPTALGAVGAYRLLAGTGYLPASMVTGAFPFVNNPPVAVAPTNYNRPETNASTAATNQVRVAYGAGMSEWCQNCHTNIHLDNYTSGALGGVGLRHPAGTGAILKPGQVTVYNTYISSGNFSATALTDAYNSLVPFENAKKLALDTAAVGTVPAAALTALQTAAIAGVDANIFAKADNANVMCLSCHRAHASAFPAMVRWNNDDTFITNSTDFTNTGGRAWMAVAYYGRSKADFGNYQRSMCNKCHGKD